MFKKTKSGKLSVKDKISLAVFVLLKKKAYKDISVTDICEKAQVSRMSFYRYFSSKDDIFIDDCDQRFEECYELISNMEDPSLESMLKIIFTFISKMPRQVETLRCAGLQYLLLKQFDSYIKYIASHAKNDKFQDALKNSLFSPFIAGGIFMVMMTWADNHYKESVEEITKLTLEVLTIR